MSDRNEATQGGSKSGEMMSMLPFADHRDLYLLIAGLLIGLVLGPGVLNKFAPNVYRSLFIGNLAQVRELFVFDKKQAAVEAEIRPQLEEQLKARGVEDVEGAMSKMLPQAIETAKGQLSVKARQAALAHQLQLIGLLNALVIGVVLISVIETQVFPKRVKEGVELPAALGKLKTIRFALLACWIAIVVARPELVMTVPVVFTIALVLIALAVGFVPLGKKKA
ncbi:hypothetical protein JD969_06440 [Planctomycetota bacterium]|nr:hypothetical protein JD969_06440 [Planctomycetota bacterium]